ncbi:MAG: heparinase II/III family protein [Clostridia bacterium]|nr:heparinase II/III family protein [Clostridia bacterium]
MNDKRIENRGVLLLLAVAFLIVGIAVVLTVVGSAGEAGNRIQNFSYQTLSGASTGDDSTDLRFLFTVDSLEYSRAGFVFSKTNQDPTIGGSGCTVHDTTAVYSAVRADGDLIEAPNGRYWVAIKMNNIPHASFSTPIYVRPFVQNGGEILYADARDLSACEALGHDNLTLGKILAAPTVSDPGEQEYHCDICGDFTDDVDMTAYNTEIATYRSLAAGFTNSDFASGSITTDLGKGTNPNYLAKHPTQGQHPRVMFTASETSGIQTALANAPSVVKEAYDTAVFLEPTDGELGPADPERTDGTHNFDAGRMNKIQLLALDYQLTGNKISGYHAIYALKNYLKRMDFQEIDGDQCRQFGYVMYNAACVYDWCYDLLTSSDKQQIVLAVEKKVCTGSNDSGKKMEVGFPPSGQNAVSGHGCEFQILRDYLSFAIAIYDEYPGWWNYIANRVYQEFVPVRNTWYAAGMVPQGASLYVRIRFTSDLFSALLLRAATGEIPYDEAGMQQVLHTVYAYELSAYGGMPRRGAFQSGDNHTTDSEFQNFGRAALIASHLFEDRTLRAQLEYFGWSYSKFDNSFTVNASVGEYLICSSGGVTKAANRHDGEPKIVYNGGWLGQIIAHDAWDSTMAATLMKIGCRTGANHDHADAGQFQIWYKGMLAGDTGSYDKYGDSHFTNYHQATIAHNCVLVNGSGQRQPSEAGSYANWQTDTYKTGTVTGYAYAYSDVAQNDPAYTYIAGDITPAYNSSTVTEANRRMLTVFDTADSNEELYFFVFDNVTAKYASYKKTFLLHVPAEPTINGKKVTMINQYGAKLVMQNVFGGDNIEKIGGANRNYVVNGSQINPTNNGDDGFWGRVEVSPNTGNKTDQMLNVMYVCDEDDPTDLTATAISNGTVKGAVLGNTAAVFVISSTRRATQFDFTNGAAAGSYKYYISGVAAGDWIVSVGGTPVGLARATEDGGLLTFTASAGTVTLTPRGEGGLAWDDVLGENGWTEVGFEVLP